MLLKSQKVKNVLWSSFWWKTENGKRKGVGRRELVPNSGRRCVMPWLHALLDSSMYMYTSVALRVRGKRLSGNFKCPGVCFFYK